MTPAAHPPTSPPSDTTLTVSGTNGALAAGEKIQVSSDGGTTWTDVVQNGTSWSLVDTTSASVELYLSGADRRHCRQYRHYREPGCHHRHHGAGARRLAITAIASDTGSSSSDFTTSDTTLTVSGTNGALSLPGRRSRSAAMAARPGPMRSRTERAGAWSIRPAIHRALPIRRGSSIPLATSALPPARPSPSTRPHRWLRSATRAGRPTSRA